MEYTIEEIAKLTHRSVTTIYKLAKRFGRKPTIDEVINRKNGRPRKY